MITQNEIKMADYISSTNNATADMHLLIEGALCLYSEEIEPLFWLARRNDQYTAAQSLAAIGTALRLLQGHTRDMQKAYETQARRCQAEKSDP